MDERGMIGSRLAGFDPETIATLAQSKVVTSASERASCNLDAVADGVEQQRAAAKEIARNVPVVAQCTGEATRNISGVTQAAGDTSATATQVLSAATDLSKQAENVQAAIGKFLAALIDAQLERGPIMPPGRI